MLASSGKPCKLCDSERYANTSWCIRHHTEREKKKRREREKKKKAKKSTTKKPKKKTVRNKLDTVFSKVIRSSGRCEKCGRCPPDVQLQTSHILSRRYLNVRWDTRNAKCLCAGCHMWWGQNPIEAVEWVKTIRTEQELEEIRTLANKPFTKSVTELQEMLEELKKLL